MSFPITHKIRLGYHVIGTDPGKDPDDELNFLLFGSLQQAGAVNVAAFIANLAPSKQRARLLAGTAQTLGLEHTPIGIGTDCTKTADAGAYDFQFQNVPYMANPGVLEQGEELLLRTLYRARNNSLILLFISGLTDAWKMVENHQELFKQKVRKVVIMGGVNITEEGLPELDADNHMIASTGKGGAANNNDDEESSKKFYKACQELGVPLIVLSREAAYAVPFSSSLYTEMALTGHPVGMKLNQMQSSLLDNLWMRSNLPEGCSDRLGLPGRCDRKWFLNTFTDENHATCSVEGKEPIWGYSKAKGTSIIEM